MSYEQSELQEDGKFKNKQYVVFLCTDIHMWKFFKKLNGNKKDLIRNSSFFSSQEKTEIEPRNSVQGFNCICNVFISKKKKKRLDMKYFSSKKNHEKATFLKMGKTF